jgi:hypothetical protein
VDVLKRYPAPPAGGGRVGELIRVLDAGLRSLTFAGAGDPAHDNERPGPQDASSSAAKALEA